MARRAALNSNQKQEEIEKVKFSKESFHKLLTLFRYLHPYRVKFIIAMLLLMAGSLTSLLFPYVMGKLVDSAMVEDKIGFFTDINRVAFLLMGIISVMATLSFFRIILFVQVAEKTTADLRTDTFFKIIKLPMEFFSKRRVGELHSRITADLSQIQNTLTSVLAEVIRQILVLIGGIIFLTFVSGKLTLVMLAVLPVLIAFAVFFGRYIRKISKDAQDKLADSNIIVEETLQGIANVKAFVRERFEMNRYVKVIQEVVTISIRGAKYRGAFASFMIFSLFGAIIAVIWYGAHMVEDKLITFGDLTAFILYSTFVGSAMGSFADLYAQIQKTLGASERVLEILDEKSESEFDDMKITKKITGDLEFKDVSFQYESRKDVQVLHQVNFRAKAGKKIAIVGPSGAGKSTITNLILGFYNPSSGKLLYDGKDASEYSITDIRQQCAIVPQDVILFGGTIKENILYGKVEASQSEIEEAARQANAHQFISEFPEGYETIVGERGIKLSGGQRQRIAIARAILKDPSILILDEATSSLDSESEKLVQESLEILMKGRTSIIIAHRLSTIREADNIIVLEKGRVVESGTHDELVKVTEGLYRHLSKLQFDW
ncbi:MAG: ABC transporter fused permease/ATP-binding protein [Sphingobacteriales bacterium]|jgi:ABC transporter fused permease/ATP-binding protein